jgi:hypothetical protein
MRDIVDSIGVWSGIAGTFIGLPALGLTYWQVYKARKEAAVARERSGCEGRVMFINVRDRVGVNDVPFKDMLFLPRVGEIVMLPGTVEGGADYRVVRIRHTCFAEPFGDNPFELDDDARMANVRVEVEPVR